MKNSYFILIPIIIGITIGVYAFIIMDEPLESQSHLTSNMLTKNGSPIIGKSSADITIVEFGDFQCTFCYKFHQNTLDHLIMEYVETGQVKYVYRDFPLNGPDSILASEATYCANDQNKYWQYHNILFKNWAGEKTGWINTDSLMKFAIEVGLNTSEFNECLSQHIHYQKVLNNEKYAKSIGIDATPSFLIFDDKEVIKIIQMR